MNELRTQHVFKYQRKGNFSFEYSYKYHFSKHQSKTSWFFFHRPFTFCWFFTSESWSWCTFHNDRPYFRFLHIDFGCCEYIHTYRRCRSMFKDYFARNETILATARFDIWRLWVRWWEYFLHLKILPTNTIFLIQIWSKGSFTTTNCVKWIIIYFFIL